MNDWITYPDEKALYGPGDPLFPATAIKADGKLGFSENGFDKRHWKSTEPVRRIVKMAFETASLNTYGPDAFRHRLARHIAGNCNSVADLLATSQNLGHNDVLTRLRRTGQISREEQRKLVTGATDG